MTELSWLANSVQNREVTSLLFLVRTRRRYHGADLRFADEPDEVGKQSGTALAILSSRSAQATKPIPFRAVAAIIRGAVPSRCRSAFRCDHACTDIARQVAIRPWPLYLHRGLHIGYDLAGDQHPPGSAANGIEPSNKRMNLTVRPVTRLAGRLLTGDSHGSAQGARPARPAGYARR